MIFGYLALATSVVLTLIAGFFSVSGMTALFAANAIGVGVMMACLEFAKVVTAGWLKMNWTSKTIPMIHKAYLTAATVVLMMITSLGIYGYLAAGHLEQKAPLAGVEMQEQGLERQIATKEAEIKRTEARLSQIDRNIESFLSNDKATAGLRASNNLQKEKDKLQAGLDARNAEVNALNEKLMPIKEKGNAVEAKLGPIKYVADMFGMKDPESAVRIVIIMIMLVFDPLAVALMISGLISLSVGRREAENNEAPEVEPVMGRPAPVIAPETEIAPVEPEEPPLEPEPEPEPEAEQPVAAEDETIQRDAEQVMEPESAVETGEKLYELVDNKPTAEGRTEDDLPAYLDEIFVEVKPDIAEPVDAVDDGDAAENAVTEEAVDEAPKAEGNILLELEARLEGSDKSAFREKVTSLLALDPEFLEIVMEAAVEVKRDQAKADDDRILGGAVSAKASEKVGADFE